MARTLVILLLSVIVLGTLATPGFAGAGLLLLLFLLALPVWWVGLTVSEHGQPGEAVARTRHHRFLGPGGPDDPFADAPYEDEPASRSPDLDA
jgi:hypothetical protein